MTNGFLSLDLTGRVAEPEGKTLEYKRDLSSPTRFLRAVVAFANTAGGQLVIGVDDDGVVVGVADPQAEEERLASLISDCISPQLVPNIGFATLRDSTVLVVEVPLSTRRPHYMTAQGPRDGVYVRLGSTTRQADQVLVAEMERVAQGTSFDSLPAPHATIADLDLEELAELRGCDASLDDLLAVGLAARHGSSIVPTHAGILAACPDPRRFLISAWVQVGRLRGPSGTDIFDQAEIVGPMPRTVDQTMEFLLKHAFKTAVFGEVRRRDVYSIPIAPIREAVVNATVHASYAEKSTPIRVGFYDNRIQIDSPGLLLPGMTVDSMRLVSRPRNPALARVFREAGIMEQWGTGIQRIYDQVAEAGLPEPHIEEIVDRVRVTIFVHDHSPARRGSKQVTSAREHQVSINEHRVSINEHQVGINGDDALVEASLGAYGEVILQAAASEPARRDDLLIAAGLATVYGNYTRHILPLIKAGLLAFTHPSNPRHRSQRYRLTDAGRDAMTVRREEA